MILFVCEAKGFTSQVLGSNRNEVDFSSTSAWIDLWVLAWPVNLCLLSTVSLACICTADAISHFFRPNSKSRVSESAPTALCIYIMVVIVGQSSKKHCIAAFK